MQRAAGEIPTNTLDFFSINVENKLSGKYSFSDGTKTKLRNSYGTTLFSSSVLPKVDRNIDYWQFKS